jgi:DNA polymerase
MTNILDFDFETYSECNLQEAGAYNYAMHPSTQAIGLASTQGYWCGPRDPRYRGGEYEIFTAFNEADEIWAHNAEFDWLILQFVMFPAREIRHWLPKLRCTMALARTCGLPESLENCAIALDLAHHKDASGKALIKALSVPSDTVPDPAFYKQMEKYALQDVRVLQEIRAKLPNQTSVEWALYHQTLKMNMRGIAVDTHFCQTAVDLAEKESKELTEEALEHAQGMFTTLNQRDKILAWCGGNGVTLPDLTAFTVSKALAGELSPIVRLVLLARQECGRSSVQKYQKALTRVCPDGRLRGELQYYGAQTGRWSSRGVQLQNIVRGKIPEMELLVDSIEDGTWEMIWEYPLLRLLSWAIRGMLWAPEGKKFIATDYASVEARGVLWLSKCKAGMQALQEGRDIYKDMASRIYGIPHEKIDKLQRAVGKTAVLGLGYGMGSGVGKNQKGEDKETGFKQTCEKNGIEISDSLAQKAVDTYRESFYEVPRFWRALEDAARMAIGISDRWVWVQDTAFAFGRSKEFLYLKMPSGRVERFFQPKIGERGDLSYISYSQKGRGTDSFYGGKIMENAVSGMCRDIMAAALMEVERLGYNPVLQVHDEIVVEVLEHETKAKVEEAIMGTVLCKMWDTYGTQRIP